MEQLRERWTGWGTRLSFAALLLVFSEWVVWQTPTTFSALDWGGIAAVYIALAAISLDLIERFQVNEVFSLLILAGLYGVVNGTLISHVTANDLPFSLVIRPLAAQPLAWIGALAAFTDWRRSDDRFSQAEIRETRQIIQDYQEVLENARARAGG